MKVRTRASLRRRMHEFSRSLLFIPALMIVAAFALFGLTTLLDSLFFPQGSEQENPGLWALLVFAGGPAAASAVLSAVSTMWAGIMGVAFSVTLVAIGLTATKYSAGVVIQFQRDRMNQATLGVFATTVIYSLLVLRTVREPTGGAGFTPVIGVNAALVLAVTSLAFLVFLIQNIANYVQPKNLVDGMAQEVLDNLHHLQAPAGSPGFKALKSSASPSDEDGADELRDAPLRGEHEVPSRETGYVQGFDWPRLQRALAALPPGASRARLRLAVRLGDHVATDEPLAFLSGVENVPDEVKAGVADAILLQDERSPEGDPEFGMANLVDIGVTAMSGGSMDPGVAQACLRQQFTLARCFLTWEDPDERFEVETPNGRVFLDRPRVELIPLVLHEARTLHEKALREGLTPVLEEGLSGATRLLVASVRYGRLDRAEEILEWTAHTYYDMCVASETDFQLQRATQMVQTAAEGLKSQGRPDLAEDLLHRADRALEGAEAPHREDVGRRLREGRPLRG
ncbi:MAG TPA: DUF2254 family protein [Candidatus Thermoplasmatota archaeon]|nr:DUF2254 family protein [Candidatus Thermoplasmatota archaeon]